MAERKPGDLTFGSLLAFIAPGFVGFVATSYHVPTAQAWLEAAKRSEQSVGVFLFSALVSVSIGVIISGLRSIVADPFFCGGCLGAAERIALPKTGFGRLKDKDTLSAFQEIIENYYRYYQFHANMAFAILLLAISRALAGAPPVWPRWWPVVLVVLVIVLATSAYGSLKRYAQAGSEILGS